MDLTSGIETHPFVITHIIEDQTLRFVHKVYTPVGVHINRLSRGIYPCSHTRRFGYTAASWRMPFTDRYAAQHRRRNMRFREEKTVGVLCFSRTPF